MTSTRKSAPGQGLSRSRWSAGRGTGRSAFGQAGAAAAPSKLKEVEQFGANPGSLRMLAYAPPGLPANAPLIVVLHGCTQNAAGYDAHAGWTALADEAGFAVLYPEQNRSNNPGGCFNWFLLADAARGLGETRSIREMIDTMAKRHRIDPARVFVTGLSAGGAMAAALLADYPEVFSAGAIIAGLPCGAAGSVQEALQAMSDPVERKASALGDAVRARSRHAGPWPRVAVWHGTADKTVTPKNAEQTVMQWVDVHGAAPDEFREDVIEGYRRRTWSVAGRPVVESISVAGMGHGAPLDARFGERKGPFMLEAGVSSTRRIAAFFGIEVETVPVAPPKAEPAAKPSERPDAGSRPNPGVGQPRHEPHGGRLDVGAVINRALKAAGLMK